MTQVAHALCPGCGANVVVFSHQLLAEVAPSCHAEVLRALARVTEAAGPMETTAERFTIAEGDGSYRCPACGAADWVPVSIDLD